MRIIAGEARGRRLKAPQGRTTRPTGERVREALFSMLGDAIVGARVLDLFAGSGALGLEALSRGAAHAVFVERDRAALQALDGNVEVCGFGSRATILPGEAADLLKRWVHTTERRRFDLVMLDPPYASPVLLDVWPLLPAVLADGALVTLERAAGRPAAPGASAPKDWDLVRQRIYGDTAVEIYRAGFVRQTRNSQPEA